MAKVIDYYAALDLPRDGTHEDLKKAVKAASNRERSRLNSPDPKIAAKAEERHRLCREALAALETPESTQQYNAQLQAWNASAAATSERQQSEARASQAAESGEDVADLAAQGWDLLYAGNVPDALMIATKARQRFPTNFEIMALLGECYLRWDDLDDALNAFRQASRLQPNNGAVYASMAQVYEKKESWKEAYEHYRKASVIEPRNVSHRAAMGLICVKAESPDEGIALLRACVAEEPDRKDVQWCLAIALIDSARLGWTYVPPGHPNVEQGYYAMNRAQAMQAVEKLREASALEHDDADLAKEIVTIRADVERNVKREFMGSWVTLGLGLFIWLFFKGIGIFFAIAYYIASMTPRYAINKEALVGVGAVRQQVAQMLQSNTNGFVGLFVMAMWGLAFPVVIVVNGIKNWTGENAHINLSGPKPAAAPVVEESVAPLAAAQVVPEPVVDPPIRAEVVPQSAASAPSIPPPAHAPQVAAPQVVAPTIVLPVSASRPIANEVEVTVAASAPVYTAPPPVAAATELPISHAVGTVDRLFCTECGTKSDMSSRFCPECGSILAA